MARLLIEGFEFASVDHWHKDPRRTRNEYYPKNISGMDGEYCFCPVDSWTIMPLSSTVATVYVSFLYRFHTGWCNDYIMGFYEDGMNIMASLAKTSGNYLRLYRGSINTTLATGATALSANTTYRITIQYTPHDTSGVFKLYIDGSATAEIDYSGDSADNTDNVAYIGIGTTGASSYGCHHYLDNIVVDDTSLPAETKIRRMLPDGAGNTSDWTATSGNDFQADSDCVGLWRLEPLNYETDSIGGQTLIGVNSPTVETGYFKEGMGAVKFVRSSSEYFYFPGTTDTNLPTGYPLKSGDTVKKFAACFWGRFVALVGSGQYQVFIAKWNLLGSQITFNLGCTNNGQLYSSWGYGTGTNQEGWNGDTLPVLSAGRWYHIGISIDGVAKTSMIRVWDEYNQTATTYNDTYANELRISTAPFSIGAEYAWSYSDAIMDEVAFFNNTKSAANFDSIRQKTYNSAKHSVVKEVPPSINDYIYTNSVGNKQLFTLGAPPSNIDTINAVMTRIDLMAAGVTTPRNVKTVMRTHSTDYDGSDVFAPWMQPLGEINLRTVNPNTSSAFTVEELTDLEVGVKAAT